MSFQLCETDEYGHTSILSSGDDLDTLLKAGAAKVNEINVANALTADEKKKNWENYMIQLVDEDGELIEDAIYSGKDSTGKHIVLKLGEPSEVLRLNEVDVDVQAYLGDLDGSEWLLQDERGNLITALSNQVFEGKTALFIRKKR